MHANFAINVAENADIIQILLDDPRVTPTSETINWIVVNKLELLHHPKITSANLFDGFCHTLTHGFKDALIAILENPKFQFKTSLLAYLPKYSHDQMFAVPCASVRPGQFNL